MSEIYDFETGDPTEEPSLYLEPGEYWFRIATAESKRSKNSGEPMIEVKLQLYNIDNSEGPFALENILITPKMKWKVDQFLACIGAHPGPGARIRIDPANYIGLAGYADFKVEEWNGRKNNKVKRFIVPDDIIEHGKNLPQQQPAFRPPPQSFAPQASYRPAYTNPPQAAPYSSPAASMPAPMNDDEIPF